jgi:hypothetical protein
MDRRDLQRCERQGWYLSRQTDCRYISSEAHGNPAWWLPNPPSLHLHLPVELSSLEVYVPLPNRRFTIVGELATFNGVSPFLLLC